RAEVGPSPRKRARGAECAAGSAAITWSYGWSYGDGCPAQELPQDVLEDTAVLVIGDVHVAVQPGDRLELHPRAVGAGCAHGHLLAGLEPAGDADDVERLLAGQPERRPALALLE